MAKTKLTKDKHKQIWRDYLKRNKFGRPLYTWREIMTNAGLDSHNSLSHILKKNGGPNRRRKENE